VSGGLCDGAHAHPGLADIVDDELVQAVKIL
jgi:hypothetical protein